ncbi:MAG: hypothetical protein JXL97_11085 [Bacteroidales bacterium]|nr:hypothetical protein [Bacteroidales bacterium]
MEKRKSATDYFMEQQSVSIEEDLGEIQPKELNMNIADRNRSASGGMVQAPRKKSRNINFVNLKSSEELQLEKEPIKVRITGFGVWKRVIVPPNAYVIHTRIGKKEPITIGLGVSFRYNPNKDAYMVIPAAMQTIGVIANCISKEKQGINILAYLQWQINDFAKAYKKLDFSETRDPLGIVNAQLREQAEAAIKDKIATMSVEEVLTDKAPVIFELTERLKRVAEGDKIEGSNDSDGLGIKITTVQIREAIVSSETLWTDLQSPFRNEQRKKSRMSFLDTENEIEQKEFDSRLLIQTGQAKTDLEIEQVQQKKMTEANEIRLKEEQSRFEKAQQQKQSMISMEEATKLAEKESIDRLLAKENEINSIREIENLENELRIEEAGLQFKTAQIEKETIILTKEAELKLLEEQQRVDFEILQYNADYERRKFEHEIELKFEKEKQDLEVKYEAQKVEIEKLRMAVQNLKNEKVLFSELIKEMPKIAAEMPDVEHLKIIQSNGDDPLMNSLSSFIEKISSIGDDLGVKLPKNDKK